MGDFLGSGASGHVYLATYKPTNVLIAVKSINLYDKNTRKQFKNDLRVLVDNKCENLIKFLGVYFYEGNVKLLLEYMNLGSLERLLKTIKKKNILPPCVPEVILAKITHQILLGTQYLHKVKHQIHRDIKPANILINSDGKVKLTDFGIAKNLANTYDFSKTFVGSKNFMSPERILGKDYSFSSDIWSIGLVIYELATGFYPFGNGNNLIEQVNKIVDGPQPEIDRKVFTQEFEDFVHKCLKKDPAERANINDLLTHPWIVENINKNDNISDFLGEIFELKIVDSKAH